ncbi:hypothetical protein Tco_1136397 [Tanacetum coccineum]
MPAIAAERIATAAKATEVARAAAAAETIRAAETAGGAEGSNMRAMVPTIEKLLERYVWGLPQPIQGNVTSFDPAIIDEAMRMARANGSSCSSRNCYGTQGLYQKP